MILLRVIIESLSNFDNCIPVKIKASSRGM